jgi:DnaK suppressor protein
MADVKLPKGYKPKKSESYMSPKQLQYFRVKLLDWRQSLLEESQQTIDQMRDAARDVSDEAERASREAEITFELRTRDRYRKLLSKIGQALKRIEDESYGYCDESGEPIGLDRLEARPIATLTIEAQERREQLERQYGDR